MSLQKTAVVFGCMLSLAILSSSTYAKSIPSDQGLAPHATGQLLVEFKTKSLNLQSSYGTNSLHALGVANDFVAQEILPDTNIALVQIAEGSDLMTVMNDLKNDPTVAYVQPNFLYSVESVLPNDPDFSKLRGLSNTGQFLNTITGTIGADIGRLAAMDIWSGTSSIITGTIVAVLDQGVDANHPDLTNTLWDGIDCVAYDGAPLGWCIGGYDFAYNDRNPSPRSYDGYFSPHGTHVAGTIAAEMNNGTGLVGVNPHAKIMNVRVGEYSYVDTAAAIKGLAFAKRNGAKIANLSRGATCASSTGCGGYDVLLYTAIHDFEGLVIASAGNAGNLHSDSFFQTPADFGSDTPYWSGLDNVIAVGATDQNDVRSIRGSNGSDYSPTRVDISAPGSSIYSTLPEDTYGYYNGTSMAAPHVAGAASLAWSFAPELSNIEIKNIILQQSLTLASLSGKVMSGKRLDLYNILQYLAYKKPVNGIRAFTQAMGYELQSGAYTSGSSVYLTWTPYGFTGSLSSYQIQVQYSGVTVLSTGVVASGSNLSLGSGDGYYTFSIGSLFGTNNYTGALNYLALQLDNTGPSQASLIASQATGGLTTGNVWLDRSPTTDNGVGMFSGTYGYEVYLSGALTPVVSGTTAATGTRVVLSESAEYLRYIQGIDSLGNRGLMSTTGNFSLNIPHALVFAEVNNAEISAEYISNEVVIDGLSASTSIAIAGGMYSINSGAYTGILGSVDNGDAVKIKGVSSSAYATTTNILLSIGQTPTNYRITTKQSPSGGGGGGGNNSILSTPTCTAKQLVCTNGIYRVAAGVSCQSSKVGGLCVADTIISSGQDQEFIYQLLGTASGAITHSPYSPELTEAYLYALKLGITTQSTIQKADMEGKLLRSHMAKMMVNYAVKVLKKTPDTSKQCSFTDTTNETSEMKGYITLACQLGLMGQGIDQFSPSQEVDRAQFGTILSRALGNTDESGPFYYSKHLEVLKNKGIMNKIDNPERVKELRGYVMLMMMRAAQ